MAEDIIGIDLGTTNSAVGVVESGFPILLADENGKRIIPSAVWYGVDGDVEVGEGALRRRGGAGEVVTSVKRYIGRRYDEVMGDDFCVPVRSGDDGGVKILVGGEARGAVEVSGDILKRLKSVAEMQLGREVFKAVVTVPAYFNDAQRSETKRAGELAGLEVVRILSEPTAAALAYGLDKLEESARVAVYDLGGGTFDISILEMRGGVFQVLATAGDTRLGGDDLDEALARWCWERGGDGGYESLDNVERQRLLDEACVVKERLSGEDKVVLQIPFFRSGLNVEVEVNGEDFEKVAMAVIGKTEGLSRRVLSDAGVGEGDLDAVVMVGGG